MISDKEIQRLRDVIGGWESDTPEAGDPMWWVRRLLAEREWLVTEHRVARVHAEKHPRSLLAVHYRAVEDFK